MKLIYKHNQELGFKIITYPDGQHNIELDLNYFNNPKESIKIECSLRNFNELEVLLCIIAALRKNDFYISEIHFQYLFGMRSDRSFCIGQPNYFRDVLAPIILNINIPQVRVSYPHSMISYSYITEYEHEFFAIKTIDFENYFVIGGDESSGLMFKCDATFFKKRIDHDIELYLDKESLDKIKDSNKYLLIVDDLCDGGLTFIKASEFLREKFPNKKLLLFVAHGLFSKGVDHVAKHYDKIITTNSYQEFEPHPKLQVIDIWR